MQMLMCNPHLTRVITEPLHLIYKSHLFLLIILFTTHLLKGHMTVSAEL